MYKMKSILLLLYDVTDADTEHSKKTDKKRETGKGKVDKIHHPVS